MALQNRLETLVAVFGGSGFLGRHVVRALAKRGYRVRVAVRRPELAICATRNRSKPRRAMPTS
jgi:nucleoside-diphosphate-sugar epimerase